MPLDKAPEPIWVIERTQGHWDCPEGYAESKIEFSGIDTADLIIDKMGHRLSHDIHGNVSCLKLDTNKGSE